MDIGQPSRATPPRFDPARFNKDRLSGGVLALLGIAIAGQGIGYGVGALTRMGTGFVPVVLGTALALTGVAIALTANGNTPGEADSRPTEWRGWSCILGSVLLFVVLGSHGGLVPATFASVTLAALGDRDNSLRDALLLATAITAAGVAIFSYGLGMIFPLFTWG